MLNKRLRYSKRAVNMCMLCFAHFLHTCKVQTHYVYMYLVSNYIIIPITCMLFIMYMCYSFPQLNPRIADL